MKARLALIFLVALLFVMGCKQKTEIKQIQEESLQINKQESKQESQQEGQEKIDLSEYSSLKQLAIIDVPIYCEGTTTAEGKTINYKIWYKHGKYRGEFTSEGITSEMIIREDGIYIKYIPVEDIPAAIDCEWLKFERMDIVTGYEEQTSTRYTKPEEINPVQYNCMVKSFSESVFEPKGNICSLADIMAAAMG